MLLWKLLLIAAVASAVAGQTCHPKFILPNTLQDSVSLSAFPNDQSTSAFTYKFTPSIFSGNPSALISMSSFELQNYAQINYLLSAVIENDNLVIKIESTNMAWKSVGVHFILHSRSDLYSQIRVVDTVGNQETTVQCLTAAPSIQGSILFVHHILGIKAVYSSNYDFWVQPAQISTGRGQFSLKTNTDSTVTVLTVYLDSLTSNFAFGVEQVSWKSGDGNKLWRIWFQFAPTVNTLIGVSRIRFGGIGLNVQTSFDVNTDLLSVKGSQEIQDLEMLVFAVGKTPIQVCYPCNNFITAALCLDQCQSNSYPYSFADGGKTCRQCMRSQGQTLQQSGNSCSCPNNEVYSQGNCYSPQNQPPKCKNDQLLLNNKCINKDITKVLQCPANAHPNTALTSCICDTGYDSVGAECMAECPPNSKRTSYGLCACNYGFIMNSGKQCESICPLNSVYRVDLKICKCNVNYEMINGVCSQCPKGQVYDPTTSSCLAVIHNKGQNNDQLSFCKANEVAVNGQCMCNQWSVRSNGHCYPCRPATFKSVNLCLPCPNYCLNCSSQSSCSICRTGFDLVGVRCVQKCGDGRRFTVECDDGNNRNGDGCSSTCKVENGYLCSGGSQISTDVCQKVDPNAKKMSIRPQNSPLYISGAIITDFIIEPPVVRTQGELIDMFKISFSNPSATPNNIFISQSENDPASIRCMYSYNSDLPNLEFSVHYEVNDYLFGFSFINMNYDTMGNGLTAAIRRPSASDVLV